MGELIIIADSKTNKYLINTRMAEHVQDDICNYILKYYPADAIVDFKQLY